ncbi:peroxide stress protein YaaA [Dysosmobacter sp.]|uniref:peroxide stress protein YaaA n=1 Tax=Dysosmobacter sp. TaxID=2591382 RepID=UPI003A9524B1
MKKREEAAPVRIIISPAKKMVEDSDTFAPAGLPRFLEEAERLLVALRTLTPGELKKLWGCNEVIATLNVERLANMDLRRAQTPALLAYEGIQYRYLAPGVLEEEPLRYVAEHLRIVSGFYGLLRPFDAVTPYRLEMQARLAVDGHRDLYSFWGSRLGAALAAETDTVVDLASREYSRAVLPYLPPETRVVTCVFGELKESRVVEKGTLCKMARGEMVRWMAQRQVTEPEELPSFSALGYQYDPARSSADRLVFLRETNKEVGK